MDLVKLDKQLPIRAYPEEELNKVIIMDLMPWVSRLLSLTDEKSADRLDVALPAIKDSCIGMGFAEIKKMFELYADNKLNIVPIPNYFDRILLGKILTEYRKQKPKKKEMPPPPKKINMDDVVMKAYLEYKNTDKLPPMITHIYEYLHKQGKLPVHNKEFKESILGRAKISAKLQAMVDAKSDYGKHKIIGTTIDNIEKGQGLKSTCQRIIIKDYFNGQ